MRIVLPLITYGTLSEKVEALEILKIIILFQKNW